MSTHKKTERLCDMTPAELWCCLDGQQQDKIERDFWKADDLDGEDWVSFRDRALDRMFRDGEIRTEA